MKIILESIDEINEFYENWNGARNVHADPIEVEMSENGNEHCFREYGRIYSVPTFKDVTPNGTILLKRGHAKNYDIHTIIALKELIPLVDEYPRFSDLKKAVGSKADQVTIKRCCYVIEHGNAEHIINKWNNMSPKFNKYGQVI